jgi:hypothetical protein
MAVAVWPLGALSAVALGLEVFESRLVAYCVPVVVLYAVLGIAMLGFGAAGSLVAMRRAWLEPERIADALAWAALAFSASIVLAHAAFVRLTPLMAHVGLLSLALSTLLALPFLAAGTAVTLALSSASNVGTAYAANLVGSGLGCFLPLALLGPLSGERFLGLLAVLAWCCALPYLRQVPTPTLALRVASVGGLGLAVLGMAAPSWVFPIQPDSTGQVAWQYRNAAESGITITKRFDRWNPTGRIEILELGNVPGGPEPYPAMFFAQDASAGSSLLAWDGRTQRQLRPSENDPGTLVSRLCTETQYAQGYFSPRQRVLVIGLGGGPDLQCALYQEAEVVDVVETNRDSIAAIRGPFNRWLGGIGLSPSVRFYQLDGRSFVRGHGEPYDLIQLSGVDTKNALDSGALAVSENHLYTLQAFHDYLDHLSTDGALSILRFGEPEALRLANTAVQALHEDGVAHAEQHIALLHTGLLSGVIVRKMPWTEPDAHRLDAQLHPAPFRGTQIFYYSDTGVPLDAPSVVDYLPPVVARGVPALFMAHVARHSVAGFTRFYPWDIAPATDDRPFFFDRWRYDRAESWGAAHVKGMGELLASVLALSLLFVLLPVRRLKQRASGLAVVAIPLFFAGTGLGFITLEMWLLHRFAIFLGHQIYSLSVVLSTLLVTTGAGAALGGRLIPQPRRRALLGIGMVLLLLIVGVPGLPNVLAAAGSMGLPARAAMTIGLVAPVGFALGLPFVAGLDHLRQQSPDSVAWCIGINGFASVLGAVAVVPLSMATGYRGVVGASAVFLALAALATVTMRPTVAPSTASSSPGSS